MKGRNRVKVSLTNGDVTHKGVSIPFRKLREPILKRHIELCMEFELKGARKFNKETGEIERKFAWDSIFIELRNSGELVKIFNQILKEENL